MSCEAAASAVLGFEMRERSSGNQQEKGKEKQKPGRQVRCQFAAVAAASLLKEGEIDLGRRMQLAWMGVTEPARTP